MRVENKSDISIVEATLDLIKEADHLLDEVNSECVIFCGDTGSGKSTLINYLIGEPLIALKPVNSRKLVIDTVNPNAAAKIGHTGNSMTFIPKKILEAESGVAFWDCPGFDDSRGAEIDIANSFYINKLFQSEALKVVLVIDESSLNGAKRGEAFKNLVFRLSEFFLDKEQLIKSTSIVFTKSRDIEDYRAALTKFLEEIRESISDQEAMIFKGIIDESPISTFDLPSVEGIITTDNREKILKNISESEFISKPEVKIIVSVNSLLTIQKVVHFLGQEIKEESKFVALQLSAGIKDANLEKLQEVEGVLKELWSEHNQLNGQGSLDKIKQVVNTLLANDEGLFENEELSESLGKISIFLNYFENFFAKILPDADITAVKFVEFFCVDFARDLEVAITKIMYKENEEKLNGALAAIEEGHKKFQEDLEQKEKAFEEMMQSKEEQIKILVERLEQEELKRADIDSILGTQNHMLESLKELMLKQSKDNKESIEIMSTKLLEVTNKMVELAGQPKEIHNHYEDDSSDGMCSTM